MKSLALGLSWVLVVLFSAPKAEAQDAPRPPTTAEQAAPSAPPSNPYVAPSPGAPALGPQSPVPSNPQYNPQYPAPPNNYDLSGFNYSWGPGMGSPPKELAYTGGPIPHGYVYRQKYNLGLLISGPILFGLGYSLAVVAAQDGSDSSFFGSSQKPEPWNALYIPLTGPFAFANYAQNGTGFIYVFLGLGQVTGLGLTLAGILRPKDILVRRDIDAAWRPQLEVGPGNVQVKMRF
jgi:hypothetical protein